VKSYRIKTLIFSVVFFCIIAGLSFSTILYAAQPISGAQGTQIQQMPQPTPKLLKATPSMISALKHNNLSPEFNAAKSTVDNAYNGLQEYLPKLSKDYSKYTSKRDECINKAYTYEDQKSAGCLPNDSVEICIGKLVGKCSETEYSNFMNNAWSVKTFLANIIFSGDIMKSELQKLEDYVKCLKNQWPKQTCQ
jgi:hypothetical protein